MHFGKYAIHSLLFFVFALIIGITACKKDHEKVYQVPTIVQPYIDDFLAEANQRGIDLVIDDLIVEFNASLDISGDDKAGICTYGSDARSPLIELDSTSLNWQLNEFTREQLVFHELGHCILGRREHNNLRLNNNNYQSVMRAEGNPIYGRLSLFKRDFYLDELFHINSENPTWSNPNNYNDIALNQFDTFLNDPFDDNAGGWATTETDNPIRRIENGYYHIENQADSPQILFFEGDINGNMDFEIEMGYRMPQNETAFSLVLWGIDINILGNINNAYYYGYSNDRFIDVGDFTTQSFTNDERTSVSPYEFNKLTIRRIGDFYYVYMNEIFFDVFAYEELPSNNIGFYIDANTTLQIDFITLSEINL